MELQKRWDIPLLDETLFLNLSRELPHLSKTIIKILMRRGLEDVQSIRNFLSLELSLLHDPDLLPDMAVAVARIQQALAAKEKILIYGDYDVDGITSTSLLLLVLRKLGASVQYYLPHRLAEGYGLNLAAIHLAKEQGIDLILTVDCGIVAMEETNLAASLNIEMVITDHHHVGGTLPNAVAVVNAKREDSAYPFTELAGVGVAYKLAQALLEQAAFADREELLATLREFVAFGTIADIVSLLGENRILVHHGLQQIARSSLPFWQALKKCSGSEHKEIDTTSIGFAFAPRLNALGRLCPSELPPDLQEILAQAATFSTQGMNSTCLGVELLLTDDSEIALKIAQFLEQLNQQRRDLGDRIFQEAKQKVEEKQLDRAALIVLVGDDWHLGVIGIVASKLLEIYYKPVLLLSRKQGILKGSARSIKGFHLFNALQKCAAFLEGYGGHELAAGVTLKEENFTPFYEQIVALAGESLTAEDLIPVVELDLAEMDLDDLSFDLLEELNALAPYGQDNKQPVLACQGAKLREYRTMGQDASHLRLKAYNGTHLVEGVWFKHGALCLTMNREKSYKMAFTVNRNDYFANQPRLQLCLVDLQEQIPWPESELTMNLGNIYSTEVLGNWAVDAFRPGDLLSLQVDEQQKILVLDRQGCQLSMLCNRLEKQILPHLCNGVPFLCWIVMAEPCRLKIAILKEPESLAAEQVLHVYASPVAALTMYKSRPERAGCGHLALSLLETSKLLIDWKLQKITHLYCSKLFYEQYRIFFPKGKKEVSENSKERKQEITDYWQQLLVDRHFLATLYKEMKKRIPQEKRENKAFLCLESREICTWLKKAGLLAVNPIQVKAGLDLLEEMQLLDREQEGERQLIFCLPKPIKKFDLTKLPRYLEQN